MSQVDPAAVPDPRDAEIAKLRADLAAAQVPAASTPAAASSPATEASSPPASSVPPPAVGTVVARTHVPAGTDGETSSYGIVVAVTDDTALVAWFNPATSLPGDELTPIG